MNINNSVYQNILSTRAIGLRDIQSLVPMAPNQLTPGTPVPVYGRSFQPQVYDPNLQTPYTQNITLSVTRQINQKFTVDARYTGTLGRKQLGSFDLNTNNVYKNPELFQALTDARAATCTANSPAYKANYTDKGINPCNMSGDPVFLDQFLAGLNINNTVAGFGAVGTVNNVFQSGAQHLRRSATFQNNLAWGDFEGVMDSLIGLAPSTAQGRQGAPINPATNAALSGVALIANRNGCDRIANGFTIVQQTTSTGGQVPGSGLPFRYAASRKISWPLTRSSPPPRITPTRPVPATTALQVQLNARPIQGVNVQTTWIWAKSMYLPGTGYIDPANRDINFQVQGINPHSIRMNGTIELPIGPNKLLFGNTSGWVARLWNSGRPASSSTAPAVPRPHLTPVSATSMPQADTTLSAPTGKFPKPM